MDFKTNKGHWNDIQASIDVFKCILLFKQKIIFVLQRLNPFFRYPLKSFKDYTWGALITYI